MLVKGLPRITRYRAGASRFSIVDPSGNTIIFIQRDEPKDLEYGGSKELEGLARVLDNARILREFTMDDRAAYRALDSGMRRRAEDAPVVEQAMALALRGRLASAMSVSPGSVRAAAWCPHRGQPRPAAPGTCDARSGSMRSRRRAV
ncbi:hypothetical protein [Micromonospora sp. NPDC050276]|uniref:hypothetical protein n=1 Tax=Micromonospora sp. NPDC050276 TaxID=3364278 RepID=UPI0037BE0EC9